MLLALLVLRGRSPGLAPFLQPTLPSWCLPSACLILREELSKPPWACCFFVPEIQATRQQGLLPLLKLLQPEKA